MKNLAALILVLCLAGCINYVSHEEVLNSAGYPPSNQRAMHLVHEAIKRQLKLGETTKEIKIKEAVPGLANVGFFGNQKKSWVICYGYDSVDSQNQTSFIEGYIGIANNKIIDENSNAHSRQYCQNAPWADLSQNSGFFGALNKNIWGD